MKYAIRWTRNNNGRSELSPISYFLTCYAEESKNIKEENGFAVIADINLAFRACNVFEKYYGDSFVWTVEEVK